ncbi:MAG: sulfotransferase [Candidatus Marinimicrobia bacterium]|nr:sulfotransferase [Candidatus Neomarinimicrobiota bacterium]MCF7905351.1 sulfotransferase [Candidatus Neomarinimicrobiota bacterium]
MSGLENSRSLLYRSVYKAHASLPSFIHPLQRGEHYHPFFIIGSGRSGNTLLRRMLHNHSNLYIPPETYVIGSVIKKFVKHPWYSWGRKVQMVYETIESYPEFHTFNLSGLSELTEKVSNCTSSKRSMAYILNAFYEFYREKNEIAAQRWGDKTPINTDYLFEIEKTFPDARFIHLIRDPYDTIYSYKKAGLYGDIEAAADRWGQSVTAALSLKSGDHNYFELEYERLVSSPEPCVRDICQYLGIAFESKMLGSLETEDHLGDVETLRHHANVKNPINTKSIGKGHRELAPSEITQINARLKAFNNDRIEKYLIVTSA